MPTQRTLLMTIASLLVIVSYLVGYISGNKTSPQGNVSAVNNSVVGISGDQPIVTKLGDPVLKQTGSSYNSVYREDTGKIYLPKADESQNKASLQLDSETAEAPKFIFRAVPKPKKAYSWRKLPGSKTRVGLHSHSEYGDVEQGDGGEFAIDETRRTKRQRPLTYNRKQRRPVRGLPVPTVPGYGMMQNPMAPNAYTGYPSVSPYYRPYGY